MSRIREHREQLVLQEIKHLRCVDLPELGAPQLEILHLLLCGWVKKLAGLKLYFALREQVSELLERGI